MINELRAIKPALEDFQTCGLEELLQEYQTDYKYYLHDKAVELFQVGELNKAKVFLLLSDACSMRLNPDSLNEPLQPLTIIDGKRSAIPDDFNSDDLKFFEEIIPYLQESALKARLAEIIWCRDRKPEYACIAIDSYQSIPLKEDEWFADGGAYWDRAIRLCFMLRAGAGNRLDDIETKLLAVFQRPIAEQKILAIHIANLLLKHHLGFDKSNNISENLENIAIHWRQEQDYFFERFCLTAAANWYQKAKNPDKANEILVKVAESFVAEAEFRQLSAFIAANYYSDAIHQYRKIPRKYRVQFDVENRVLQLKSLMQETALRATEQVGSIQIDPIDIGDLMGEARQRVTDKNIHEALVAFLNMYNGREVEDRRKEAEKTMQKFPVLSLFPTVHTAEDGRVIAKSESGCLWNKMLEYYRMEIHLVTMGCILPALEILRLEHRLTELDFYSLTLNSPVIPERNRRLMAKALFFGYDGDYSTALHILAPQMESLIRYHLKQNGEQTTHIDDKGIEEEVGLNTLIDKPKIEEIFGKNIIFEIKALFCDPTGLNFRNEVAHGLINYDKAQGVYSLYVWWLMFKLTFNTLWNRYYSLNHSES